MLWALWQAAAEIKPLDYKIPFQSQEQVLREGDERKLPYLMHFACNWVTQRHSKSDNLPA
jgi:hypothetical protein